MARVLATAEREGDVEVEVLALDALAHGYARRGRSEDALATTARADHRMTAAQHLLVPADRIDRISRP
jgi:hypothetical protein